MNKDELPGLSPLWLISLALVLGVLIVTFVPVSIMGGDTVKGSDWIGFAGSIIGSAVTLTAAVIAWFAVKRQINVAREVAIIRENETWSVLKEDIADVVANIDYVWRNIDRASLHTDNFARYQWRMYQARESLRFLPKSGKIASLKTLSRGIGAIRERRASRVFSDLDWLEKIAKRWPQVIYSDVDDELSEPMDEADEVLAEQESKQLEEDIFMLRVWLTKFFENLKRLDPDLAAQLEPRQKANVREMKAAHYVERLWRESEKREGQLFPKF